MQIALLSNPDSGRKKQLRKIIELAKTNANISYFLASNTEQFIQFVEKIRQCPVDLVVINAGDGTIQALLTQMFARLPEMPVLAILKGGTTNMTAGDVGIRGSNVSGLKKLIALNQPLQPSLRTETRPILKIDWDSALSPVCGLFFGAGAIIEGQDYFHSTIHKKGLRDSIGPALSALRLLFSLNNKQQTLFSPVQMQMTGWDAQNPADESSARPVIQTSGEHLVAFASGLERLFVGIHPFWGACNGDWYFSAVQHQPTGYSLLRLLPLFVGKPSPDMLQQQWLFSTKLNRLEIHMEGEFTVDGERYRTTRENPLITVTLAGYANFLQL